MIKEVKFEKSTYNDLPFKFEGGTPNIAGGIGLEACVRFMEGLGMDHIERHESSLLTYATEKLNSVEGIRILGESKKKIWFHFFFDGRYSPF